jgi:hypothetical protein
MKKVLIVAAAAVFTNGLMACSGGARAATGGDTPRVTRTLDHPATFSKIAVAGAIDVIYTQNDRGATEVTYEAPAGMMEFIEVYSEGGTLTARMKPQYRGRNVRSDDNFRLSDIKSVSVRNGRFTVKTRNRRNGRVVTVGDYGKVIVRATSPALECANVAGSGDLTVRGGLDVSDFHSSLAGSGDMQIDALRCDDAQFSVAGSGDVEVGTLKCRDLKLSVAGAGDVTIDDVRASRSRFEVAGSGDVAIGRGTTVDAACHVVGSGSVHAGNLMAENVTANIAGSGSVSCHATESIRSSVVGSGSLTYSGNPRTVDNTKKGSGTIRRR